MAGFSVNTVTVKGLTLLARASAASQLIYTRVLGSTEAMVLAEAEVAEVSDFPDASGVILSASADVNRAIIRGVFYNQPASVTLRSFALCARIEGDASDVVLAVQSDPDAAVIVPGETEPDAAVEVGWLLDINNAESVTVESIGPGTVAFGDIARFVSMWKAGDPTTGETQTIKGEKHFDDALVADGSFSANSAVILDDGATINNDVELNGNLTLGGMVIPDTGDTYDLGTTTAYFRKLYVQMIECADISVGDIALTGSLSAPSGSLGEANDYIASAYITDIYADTVEAEVFKGVLPHPTVTGGVLSVEVGALVCIYLPVPGISEYDYTGETFTVSGGSPSVYTVIFTAQGEPSQGSFTLPNGTYSCIGGGSTTSGGNGWALAMRIA